MPRPKSRKDIQRLLGMLNYDRSFVRDFAKIAKPLYLLLEKDTAFGWGPEEERAFNWLKNHWKKV